MKQEQVLHEEGIDIEAGEVAASGAAKTKEVLAELVEKLRGKLTQRRRQRAQEKRSTT